MWSRQAAIISVLFISITLTHSYEINALQTGTVVFEDKFIKLNTCMAKKVELKLTKDYYDNNQDISVIVSIFSLKMNDQLTFYIYHNLNCNKINCELEINLQRYTPEVNKLFSYQVTIDYLIAQGLKTVDFNMTFYKQHFQIPTFEQNMNVEEWNAILIPYGFSDLKLLGNIESEIIVQSKVLKLTYIDPNNLDNKNILQSWTLSKKFVLYKVLFIPKSYLRNRQNKESYIEFVGFKSTRKNQIVTQLYFNSQNELIFQSNSELQEDSYFRIPVRKTELFYENRQHPTLPQYLTKKSIETSSSSSFQRLLLGAVLLVILQLFYLIYKKKMHSSQSDRNNQTDIFPDLIVSFDSASKNAANLSLVSSVSVQTQLTSN